MSIEAGIFAAFIAFLAWGFGDFAIQRSVRGVGAVPALFFIGIFGLVGLLPFVWNDLHLFFNQENLGLLLLATGIVTFAYAIFFFESLGRGKISVVEPVMSFELPMTIAIGVIIIGERLSLLQFVFALTVFAGLIFTVVRREPRHWWNIFFRQRSRLEQGVILAGIAVLLSAGANVLTGVLSQDSKPLLAIWGVNAIYTVLCLIWMLARREMSAAFRHAKTYWRPIALQGVLDNAAWVGFAAAVQVLPISITIAITESYIALAALLGILINKEKLQRHQYIGIAITLIAAVVLAVVSER
ncbi:MAG: DMT family transporter [Candidatus Kerfeldbacteria bacterium]|nr:DMT family transporter [Candidatus Kerfeldbacteria bacterium]